MSYILEALKKSQQEREFGQVPTLDTADIFLEDKELAPANHWGLLAVGLAALAVVIALYAALRDPATPAYPPPPSVVGPAMTPAPPNQVPSPALGLGFPDVNGIPLSQSPYPSVSAPRAPLVEAPPPKRPYPAFPGNPGTGYGNAAGLPSDEDLYSEANLDLELERELQRQLDAEQAPYIEPEPVVMEPPEHAPVPTDLIDDIEAFKQQVRREQGIPPPDAKSKRARISGDPTRLHLTPQQQAQVPGYLMTVHVYDADVAKRFVHINALKYRQGEETREGFRIERILPDGAVLSYLGNPFYVSR